MDRNEPTGTTNSNNIDSEISAAHRILNGTGNFLKNNKNKAMAALAAGALTITLAGCGSNARAEGPTPSTTISAEPSPEPSASSTPSSSETAAPDNPNYVPGTASVKDGVEVQVPENPTSEFIDSGEFTGEKLKQTKTLEEMQKMTVEKFAQLPFADRIAFAALAFPKSEQKLNAPFLEVGNDDFDGLAWTLPSSWEGLTNLAYAHKDPDTRAKLAGSYSYYTTDKQDGQISSSYQAAADSAARKGGEGVFGDRVCEYVSNGKVQHGIDRDGNPIDFMNITYKDGSTSTIDSITDVKTAQVIRTDVTLLDGREFVYYALGYVIDGTQSPVDGYDY